MASGIFEPSCVNTSSTITTSAITKASTTSSRCVSGRQARERSDATNASAGYWATIGGRPHSAADPVFGQDAIAAEWTWLDDGRRLLSIPVTDFWRPKSGKPREVPVGDALARTLAKLPRTSRHVFPNFHGERFAEFPNKRFAAIVDAAGLTGGPHTCRHTYASHFLRAVPDLF